MSQRRIALIGIDWGSTHVRAFAFDETGEVVERAQSNAGAMTLTSGAQFDAALVALVKDWQLNREPVPMIACGMVGARGGWVEAGYCDVNADARALNAATISIANSLGKPLRVIPGLKNNLPDVMRGEETQIMGAQVHDGVLVLPGTHSKWATVVDRKIASFATFFTGEMNALLRNHSAIGKAISSAPDLSRTTAIERGIQRAKSPSANWLNDLFAFRARVVTAAVSEFEASSELSAWLIASEFAQAASLGFHATTVHVLASESLLPWYERIAHSFDLAVNPIRSERATARGLWKIANASV